MIMTLEGKGSALTHAELDGNFKELDRRTMAGWKDLVSPLTIEGLDPASAASYLPFGPSGNRAELAFGIGDMAYCKPFHVNHDVKVGGRALLHVHWSTNGASTGDVRWTFEVMRALGHQQAYFGGEVNVNVEQAGYGGAWRHMIGEVDINDALVLTEPDELILVTLHRTTPVGLPNNDTVFAILVDLHYESDRDTTPQRSPDFYTP